MPDQADENLNRKKLVEIINKSLRTKQVRIPLRIRTSLHPQWIPYTFKRVEIKEELHLNFKGNGSDFDLSNYVKLVDLKMEEAANDDLIISVDLDLINPSQFSADEVPPIYMEIYNEKQIFVGNLKTIEKIRVKQPD